MPELAWGLRAWLPLEPPPISPGDGEATVRLQVGEQWSSAFVICMTDLAVLSVWSVIFAFIKVSTDLQITRSTVPDFYFNM